MIEIRSLRYTKPKEIWQVRCDRRSVVGNPFTMAEYMDRDIVCDQYEEYFEIEMNKHGYFAKEIRRLIFLYKEHGKLDLFCWCAPRRCHTETIRKYILEQCNE